MENNFENKTPEVRDLDIREQVSKYVRHWPWFILSIILTLSIATLYLRYANPIFSTNATILIKDDANRNLSEMAAFQDIGVAGGLNASSFENEIQVLKSNSLTKRVVKNLDLNVNYYSEGSLRTTELFGNIPFKVGVITPDSLVTSSFEPFYIQLVSSDRFKLLDEDKAELKEYSFGEVIPFAAGDIQVLLDSNNYIEGRSQEAIKVHISSIPSTVARYRNSIEVEQMTKLSSVIQLTLNAANRSKSEAVLNEFIEQYNEDAVNDRSMVARNTAEFIQERLEIISEELDSVETGKVEFKQSHKLTDMEAEGRMTLQKESEFARALLDIDIQMELLKMTTDYIEKASDNDLLPLNTGIDKEGIVQSISTYNNVVMERTRLLSNSTEKNPTVVSLTRQIRELRGNILEGLHSARASLEIRKNDLVSQNELVDTKISTAPSKEKIFRSISRQQELKEALYLYLLQKREENAISMAVTTPKAKVVDYAYSSLMPISPKSGMIMIVAGIAGLLIPFLFIYLSILLDNKIRNKFHVEQEVPSAPVVGELPKIHKKEIDIVQANDRSIMAESFRILSTNLEYLFINNKEKDDGGRIVLVTSTIKGEGKTFVSANLAVTLANAGSRVILIGGDLRNPQIHRYAKDNREARHKKGVVEYLVHKTTHSDDYIEQSTLNADLDIMYSGTIPPNPAELLKHERMGELFEELKVKYDYIIVDTAPAMLVADTFLLRDYADSTIYVTRAGFTQKHLLGFAEESIRFKKLKNVAFVINNVSADDLGYGSKYGYYYSYGYGYGTSTKSTLWKRLTQRF